MGIVRSGWAARVAAWALAVVLAGIGGSAAWADALLVSTFNSNGVQRVNLSTGAVQQDFIVPPWTSRAMELGPDGRLYVSQLVLSGASQIRRYDPNTGAYLDTFTSNGVAHYDMEFGPDGMLYGADRNTVDHVGLVARYYLSTHQMSTFVSSGEGGLLNPWAMAFGPDGNLYVSSDTGTVRRYSGSTGSYLGEFVSGSTSGLQTIRGLAFGPDHNFYVTDSTQNAIYRFDGVTGASLGAFVTAGSGGLTAPQKMLFAPDGFLYVTHANGLNRYSAATGAFDEVVSGDPSLLNAKEMAYVVPAPGAGPAAVTLGGLLVGLGRKRLWRKH